MKRLHTAILVALLTASPAIAQGRLDHLEPQISAMDVPPRMDIGRIVHTIFAQGWNDDIILRGFVMGGGLVAQGDDMVALRHSRNGYSVIHLHTPEVVMKYFWWQRFPEKQAYEKGPEPSDYSKVQPDRCEIAIDSELAREIIHAWYSTLMDTRYYSEPVAAAPDTGWIRYSMQFKEENISGEFPQATGVPDSKPVLVGAIAYDMQRLCDSRGAVDLQHLKNDANQFLKRFH